MLGDGAAAERATEELGCRIGGMTRSSLIKRLAAEVRNNLAGTATSSPVRGLRPTRSPCARMENVPKRDNGSRANLMFGPPAGKGGGFMAVRNPPAKPRPQPAGEGHFQSHPARRDIGDDHPDCAVGEQHEPEDVFRGIAAT